MSLGFWNVRGLNKPSKMHEIKWFLHNNKLGLFGLLETRVKACNTDRISTRLGLSWEFSTNYASHPGEESG